MERSRLLRGIQRRIEKLGANEHGVLLNMLNEAGIKCAENSNGYFFNLVGMDDDLVTRISEFVNYSIENNRELEQYDRAKHTKVQLLQRVPAVSQASVAKKGPRVPGEFRREAPEVQKEPQTARTARLAFVRRATDTVKKSRVLREDLVEFDDETDNTGAMDAPVGLGGPVSLDGPGTNQSGATTVLPAAV